MAESDLTNGTITLTNGSANFTGTGTSFAAVPVRAGDTIIDLTGTPYQAVIDTITSNTAGTLTKPWQGPTLTTSYRLRFQSEGPRMGAQARNLIELLSSHAFFQYDASGTLAERAAYDSQRAGFSFLRIDTDPHVLYIKASDTSGDWSAGVDYGRGPQGATGATGPKGDTGNTGAAGADGRDPGILLTWQSSTADTDPGTGGIRANNASLASATTLFVDNLNRAGSSIAAYLAGLASSTSPIKGTLVLTSTTNTQATFNVTGVTVASGYVKVAVSGHSGATSFAAGTAISFQFSRTGNAGAGSGDVSGAASSVADRIATFTDTSGKAIKDSGKSLSDFYERSAVDAMVRAAQDPVDRVAAVPSLDLVMTGPGALQSGWFSRASTGTYFDNAGVLRTAAANEPRYEYDPVTGQCLGLLIEEQRTNLLTYSEQIDNAVWSRGRLTIAQNVTTAPDGALSADKLVDDTQTGTHAVSQTVSIAGEVAASVFLKAGERARARVQLFEVTGSATLADVYVDLTAGTVSSGSGRLTALAGGWYRVDVTGTSTNASKRLYVYTLDSTGSLSYTGDGVSGLFMWGAQLESGAFPTSYIPTTTAAATRAADDAVIAGGWSQPWFNPVAGTFLAVGKTNDTASVRRLLDRSTGNNGVLIQLSANPTGRANGQILGMGGSVTFNGKEGVDRMQFDPIAYGYSLTDAAMSVSGISAEEVSRGTPSPAGTSGDLWIGRGLTGGHINGHIRRVTYFPVRLSNAELQALTA